MPTSLADLPWRKARQTLSLIKSAAEEKRTTVILVVNERAAAPVLGDEDWSARFEIARLSRWRVDSEFLTLLSGFEKALPLQEVSHLANREMALHLYSLCNGNIGRLARILQTAALQAIENGTERITITLLDAMGFSPPASFKGFPF